MADRTGFGDDAWRLAVDGDATALREAAELLLDGGLVYEGRRACAFADALRGDLGGALAGLDAGRGADWPFAPAFAVDAARIRYLGGDLDGSLAALRRAAEGAERLDPAIGELVTAIVERAPRLRLQALRVVLAGGTALERLRNAAGVAVA